MGPVGTQNQKYDDTLEKLVISLIRQGRTGLATDIDGTLSPIAEIPTSARISDSCRKYLKELANSGRLTVIAIVTGRAAGEAREMVGLPDLIYSGNHGLEVLLPGESSPVAIKAARPYLPLVSSSLDIIRHNLQEKATGSDHWQQGLFYEDKGITASIHYRRSPEPDRARLEILQMAGNVAGITGLRVGEGRRVVELKPPVEVSKGTALIDLVETHRLQNLVYLGDDLTDVEAFKSLRRLGGEYPATEGGRFRGIAVGVTSPEMPPSLKENTDFMLDGVRGVEQFLERLAHFASAGVPCS